MDNVNKWESYFRCFPSCKDEFTGRIVVLEENSQRSFCFSCTRLAAAPWFCAALLPWVLNHHNSTVDSQVEQGKKWPAAVSFGGIFFCWLFVFPVFSPSERRTFIHPASVVNYIVLLVMLFDSVGSFLTLLKAEGSREMKAWKSGRLTAELEAQTQRPKLTSCLSRQNYETQFVDIVLWFLQKNTTVKW